MSQRERHRWTYTTRKHIFKDKQCGLQSTNRQRRLRCLWLLSPKPYLGCGGRVDGQRHKLGGKPERAQLALDQLAVDAVEESIVGRQSIEVGVDAARAEQPRQRLVKLPAAGSYAFM